MRISDGSSDVCSSDLVAAILRAPRAGDGNADVVQLDFNGSAIPGLAIGVEPQSQLLDVAFYQTDMCFIAPGCSKIMQRVVVDGKETRGGAVFRRHIGNHGTVACRQGRHAGAVKLEELTGYAQLAKLLGYHQRDEIG